jgi:hypothetical protein
VRSQLRAFESDAEVFARKWDFSVARDHV